MVIVKLAKDKEGGHNAKYLLFKKFIRLSQDPLIC